MRAAALLLSASAASCAGSGEPPRPAGVVPDGMPQDASLALDGQEPPEGPTPPALVPPAAVAQTQPAGGPVGEPAQPALISPTPADLVAAQPSIAPGATAVTLAPMVGLPDGAASNLSRALAARAPAYGLQLASSGTGPGALTVKGYLAAVPAVDGGAAIHVWDIYDASGRRLHRVEGRQAMGEGAAWADLPPSAWDAIADQAWGGLATWLKTRTS